MAKKSLILKNLFFIKKKKVNKKVKKYSLFILFKLQKKIKFCRFVKRCYISGRNRSVYNRFCLNRNLIRKIGLFGYICGLEKSSW